jgi:hypothetical protein
MLFCQTKTSQLHVFIVLAILGITLAERKQMQEDNIHWSLLMFENKRKRIKKRLKW